MCRVRGNQSVRGETDSLHRLVSSGQGENWIRRPTESLRKVAMSGPVGLEEQTLILLVGESHRSILTREGSAGGAIAIEVPAILQVSHVDFLSHVGSAGSNIFKIRQSYQPGLRENSRGAKLHKLIVTTCSGPLDHISSICIRHQTA